MSLDKQILAGEEAKSELIRNLSKELKIYSDFIEISCDTYDNSLEIYFYENEFVDIETLFNKETAEIIEKVSGSNYFWVNLCREEYPDGQYQKVQYKDCHSGWLKQNLQDKYKSERKKIIS